MSDVHMGFTGTQRGMTVGQAQNVAHWLREYRERLPDQSLVLHHGDCVGADHQAHVMAHGHGWEVEIHPGLDADGNSPRRAHAENSAHAHVRAIHEPCPYTERNMDIVLSAQIVLAAPDGPERRRSGTWSTVRAAERMGRMVVVFMPDGEIEMRNEDVGHDHEEAT